MRASEFITERRKRKKKMRWAAYGPGPFGMYGVNTGYSGDGGGSVGETSANNKLLDKPTLSITDLSKKHKVDQNYLLKQLRAGIKIELEHTSDPKVAKEIALDHLAERPDYYERLKQVENFADNNTGEAVEVEPGPQHRVAVKITDPETYDDVQKIVRVTARDQQDAIDQVEEYFANKDIYIVNIKYIGMVGEGVAENFADGKNPGRKGLAKRSGVNTKASVSSLRKTAKNSSGEKQRMAHWLANMKAGRAKKRKVKEAQASDAELRQRYGDFDPEDKPMLPTTQVGGAPAPTLWTAYEAIQSILGKNRVTDDEDNLEPGMYYVYQSNEPPMFRDTEDEGPGGSINVPNLDSKAARDVAIAVHEACHAYVHDRTQGQGVVHANEKIINNLAEKWLRKHLSGPALHVAIETITGSRISYGKDHMPTSNPNKK